MGPIVSLASTPRQTHMKARSLLFAGPALAFLCALGTAFIHPNAPSASHALEQSADGLHSYMHMAFGSSFGSHGVDVEATELHDTLHDWENGNATECEVIAERDDIPPAIVDMTQQFAQNGIFSNKSARAMFLDVLGDWHLVRFYLILASC